MKTRLRFLGALLALSAFSAYFAEGVWAAMCPPDMGSHAHAAAQVAAAQVEEGPHAGHAGMHHSAPESSDSSERSPSDPPPCPFVAVGAGSSCVSASLPGAGTSLEPLALVEHAVSISPDTARDLLLVSTLFHPPRS